MGWNNAEVEQIRRRSVFKEWIRERGAGTRNQEPGTRNRTGDSIQSYVTYLERVSRVLEMEVGPKTVRSRTDAERIAVRLVERGVNKRSAAKCRTAR